MVFPLFYVLILQVWERKGNTEKGGTVLGSSKCPCTLVMGTSKRRWLWKKKELLRIRPNYANLPSQATVCTPAGFKNQSAGRAVILDEWAGSAFLLFPFVHSGCNLCFLWDWSCSRAWALAATSCSPSLPGQISHMGLVSLVVGSSQSNVVHVNLRILISWT